MLFFPGEKFGKDASDDENSPSLYLKTTEDAEGILAVAEFSVGGKSKSAAKRSDFRPEVCRERTLKIAVGAAILSAGGELLGYRPSWGMLVGVRPAKVASDMLRTMSKTKVKKVLTSDYNVIPKKASLAVDVAITEEKIAGTVSPKDCSVYISIPFCPSRCAYCSFVSYTTKNLLSLIPEYLIKLGKEIERDFATIRRLGLDVKTVYIGGGTPTILDERQLDFLLSVIARNTDAGMLGEFTLEAGRPDTITAEKLRIAKDYGVSRISVNPQSINDDVLAGIGRNHTIKDFFTAFELARASGIKTINVDLIAGLPGDSFKIFSSGFDSILSLAPENLTVHTLACNFDILRRNSSIYPQRGGDVGKCVDYSQIKALQAGYFPYYMYRQKNTVGNYENVGFSKPGHEGLYNVYMMEELHTIFASGAGAVTKLVDFAANEGLKKNIERIFNPKYPYEYLSDDKTDIKAEQALKFYTEHKML